ncbi:MAG TPA: HEAT repeat domain-containing protein [Candidatus Obscuribacterales bacterium]
MDLYYVFAGNINTPSRVLERLALFREQRVRCHLAENPQLSPDLLQCLAEDQCWEVREAVTHNPATPAALLERLAADDSPDVRYSVAECLRVPESALEQLAGDENPYVAERASRTLLHLRDGAGV